MYSLIEGRYGNELIFYNVDPEICKAIRRINKAFDNFEEGRNYSDIISLRDIILKRIKRLKKKEKIEFDMAYEKW